MRDGCCVGNDEDWPCVRPENHSLNAVGELPKRIEKLGAAAVIEHHATDVTVRPQIDIRAAAVWKVHAEEIVGYVAQDNPLAKSLFNQGPRPSRDLAVAEGLKKDIEAHFANIFMLPSIREAVPYNNRPQICDLHSSVGGPGRTRTCDNAVMSGAEKPGQRRRS